MELVPRDENPNSGSDNPDLHRILEGIFLRELSQRFLEAKGRFWRDFESMLNCDQIFYLQISSLVRKSWEGMIDEIQQICPPSFLEALKWQHFLKTSQAFLMALITQYVWDILIFAKNNRQEVKARYDEILNLVFSPLERCVLGAGSVYPPLPDGASPQKNSSQEIDWERAFKIGVPIGGIAGLVLLSLVVLALSQDAFRERCQIALDRMVELKR